MRIHDILDAKPQHDVVTVPPGSTVRELVELLAEHNVGALVVSSDGSAVEGIVSERDVVRHLHRDPAILEATVSTIMTAAVHTATRKDKVDDMMSLMTEHRVRHIPVIEDDVLVGIVSIGDVVKHKIQALEFERDQLDSYVHQSDDPEERTAPMDKPEIEFPGGPPPTDLEITDVTEGDGTEAESGKTVSVHYVGVAHSTGEEFDASYNRGQPLQFRLGVGQVITGWDTGVQGMKVGGRRRLVIPPHLAYGDRGAGGVIGPGETLIFVVDLVAVQ